MPSPSELLPAAKRVSHGALTVPDGVSKGNGLFIPSGGYRGLAHSESAVTVLNMWQKRRGEPGIAGEGSDRSASGSSLTEELPSATDPWALPEMRPEEETRWADLSAWMRCRRVVVNWLLKPALVVTLLYLFICSLDFLSSAFQLVGGKMAGQVLVENPFLKNPICGLMIGLLSTVLVQSSSTSTSITVTMVASGILTVKQAIPMIMGANIGTSITNTIVSLAHSSHKDQFRRAFAGATVHDMFNWLCVVVLLPLEVGTGYLYHASKAVVESFEIQKNHTQGEEAQFLKRLTQPFTSRIIQMDKHVIELIAVGSNDPELEHASLRKRFCAYETHFSVATNQTFQNGTERCKPCAFLFNTDALSDTVAGVLLLGCSLVMLCGCLVLMVKVLNSLLRGSVAQSIRQFINNGFPGVFHHLTGYAAIVVGAGLTIIMQSSSVFTSALTPLVGVGIISLERMYPLTLGSNLGTTGTGILAALASGGGKQLESALQIAFCHLFFNISGILLFYPLPVTRVPIQLARMMGNTTADYRWFALLYLTVMYFALPGLVFVLSLHPLAMYLVGVPLAGLILLIVLINVVQRKCPRVLPEGMRTWKWLPVWMRSLEPYDRVFRKVNCCNKCGDVAKESVKGVEDGRMLRGRNGESRTMLLRTSPGSSVAPSRVTSSAQLPVYFDRDKGGRLSVHNITTEV